MRELNQKTVRRSDSVTAFSLLVLLYEQQLRAKTKGKEQNKLDYSNNRYKAASPATTTFGAHRTSCQPKKTTEKTTTHPYLKLTTLKLTTPAALNDTMSFSRQQQPRQQKLPPTSIPDSGPRLIHVKSPGKPGSAALRSCGRREDTRGPTKNSTTSKQPRAQPRNINPAEAITCRQP